MLNYGYMFKSILVLSSYFSWTDRIGIITSPEALHVTAAIHTRDHLERQGTRVILRTIEPITYGSDQVSYVSQYG